MLTEVTFGVSGHWLGTRTRAGGPATLAQRFFAAAHGFMNNRRDLRTLGASGYWLGTRAGVGGTATLA